MRLLFSLLIFNQFTFAAASTAPAEWIKWAVEQQAELTSEFALKTAQDLIHLQKDTEMFANPNGKGSFEFQTKRKPETVFSVKWAGGDDLTVFVNGKTQIVKAEKKEKSRKVPPTKVREGMALDGFYPKEKPYLSLFLYDSKRKGIDAIRKFEAFNYDPAFKVTATFQLKKSADKITIPTTRGEAKQWTQLGLLNFKIGTQAESIKVFDDGSAADFLFLMFQDATNGSATYGGGRYLEVEIKKPITELKDGETVVLDFNFAWNPLCVRSKAFMCPVPQDRLVSKILAGEKKVAN